VINPQEWNVAEVLVLVEVQVCQRNYLKRTADGKESDKSIAKIQMKV